MPSTTRPVHTLLLAATLAALAAPGRAAAEGALRVTATNVESDAGSVVVQVYDKADAWLGEGWRTRKVVKVAGNRAGDRVTVEILLPAGEYALSVFQDVDDDGKLARNFIGLPKEPAGLSNNLRPKFGPPRWKDAKFALGEGVTVQEIALQ
jgi:uncharacterized protein (DUF2141 family)